MAWDAVVGHEFAKRLFRAHLTAGKVGAAYLLVGPEGIGKRRLALEMTKALNCAGTGARPCDICPSCGQFQRGTHPDLHQLAPRGAAEQIRIDDIRALIGRIALRPFSARVQVVILDGADRLTEEAANSLLKALEEPSAVTRMFLTTARLPECLPTIVSRCQLIRCEPLPREAIVRLLIERENVEPVRAARAAALSGGSVSRALAMARSWESSQRIFARLAQDSPSAWAAQPLPETREDVAQLLDGLLEWVRDVSVASVAGTGLALHQEQADALERQARRVDPDDCLRVATALVELRASLEQFVSPRLIASLAREHWLSLLATQPATAPS